MRDNEKNTRTQWRLVVPDVPELKKQIMRELHEVPYSGHLGYHKTLKKYTTFLLLARAYLGHTGLCLGMLSVPIRESRPSCPRWTIAAIKTPRTEMG